MPTSFSIDDVRDSFRADVSGFLKRIERGAQAALALPVLRLDAWEGEARPSFEPLADLGHAIYGTASLVDAVSLRDSARALEELAHAAEEAVGRAEKELARARAVAEACVGGARQMRKMLFIELDHRGADALVLSRELTQQAQAILGDGAAPAAAAAPADEAFDFSDQHGPVEELAIVEDPAPAGEAFTFEERDDGFGGELLAIFRTEGEETVRQLGAELAQLRARLDDPAAAGNVERLFHTLKGAAATVGLEEISRAAARLQERMEEVLENGTAITPELLSGLVKASNEMLAGAGLPQLDLPEPAPAASAAQSAAHGFFLDEAREILIDAGPLVETLTSGSAEAVLRARGELRKLFHRLKGSALILGENAVGKEAAAIQALLERDEAATTAHDDLGQVARAALARIATLLGQPLPTGAAPAAPPAPDRVREEVTLATEPELWEAFLQESSELIESVEREALALEESTQPRQGLERLMNLLHTLKGVMNTIGLAPTARLLHRVEDFIETLLKAPILPPMRSVATLLLKVKADVHRNLGEARHGYVETSPARLETRIARVLLGGRGPRESVAGSHAGGSATSVLARDPGASVHSIAEARSARGLPTGGSVAAAAPSSPEGSDDLVDRRFIRVGTERLDALMNLAGELVVSRSRLLSRVGLLRGLQLELGRGSRRLVETVDAFREGYDFASLDGRGGGRALASRPPGGPAPASPWEAFGELELDRYEDIHIFSRRLAEVVSDVTELSTQLSRSLASFTDDSQSFDSIVSGIQSEVTRARMVPLEQLFARLRLPVRDAAGREGKEVRVATEGAEVTLDKTIADGLFAPMLHLVRNAVVHGVEGSGARQAGGKPVVGVITLQARQDSGQIVLEVRDDGGGLDLEALRARGAKMGLLSADTPLEDPAIKDLVFAPGLSTRAEAGAVSGRGVGCDVVRRTIERMNGTIQVESEAGKGTIFTITLPVTLAIAKALLVRQGGRSYAIPLPFAERIVDTQDEPLIESAGVRRLKLDESYVTVNSLEQQLGGSDKGGGKGPVLILRVGDQRSALQVDAVLGQEEIVVKSLGHLMAGHPLFAGVTIRGSGELVLIVDIPGLMETKARKVERRAPALARAAATPAREPAPAAPKRSRLRALFVDDSLSVRKYAELTFKGLGVDLTVAVDGIDAMNRLRSETFDIVFTDLEMPRMHGFELIRELRFLPAYRDLPIVVVTSRSGQKHQQQAKNLGATEYLTKPFSAETLEGVLRRWGHARRELEGGPGTQGLRS